MAAQRGVRLHLRASDRDEAARRLQLWKHHVTVSGIGEFIRMWRRTVSAWEEQILNYFDDRVTNAFAEGITSKVKGHQALRLQLPAMHYRSKVLTGGNTSGGPYRQNPIAIVMSRAPLGVA